MNWLYSLLLGRLNDATWNPSWTKLAGILNGFFASALVKYSDFFEKIDPEAILTVDHYSMIAFAGVYLAFTGIRNALFRRDESVELISGELVDR